MEISQFKIITWHVQSNSFLTYSSLVIQNPVAPVAVAFLSCLPNLIFYTYGLLGLGVNTTPHLEAGPLSLALLLKHPLPDNPETDGLSLQL